jgi:broad specificity phosphatase PhoE
MHEAGITIVFVRHGHVEDNSHREGIRLIGVTDVPLSARGLEEAGQLAACFERAPQVDAFYTSPLARARGTAEAIAHVIGRAAQVDPALSEINCGELEGLPIAAVRADHPQLWQQNEKQDDEAFRWPGGESYAEFRARALGWLGRLTTRHPDGVVVAVTHSGFISQVLGAIQGLSPARWEANRPGNTTLTTITWSRGGGDVLSFDVGACTRPPHRIHRDETWSVAPAPDPPAV